MGELGSIRYCYSRPATLKIRAAQKSDPDPSIAKFLDP
jgi:hypothetical protein